MGKHRWNAGGGALGWPVLVAALFLASPAAARPTAGHIAEASARFGIPEEWIRRVIRAESGGRTTLNGRPITSRAGAMGLMQLMPGTWREMRTAHGLGTDPYDPRDNILAGTAYLRAMFDRFGYPGLFAAYNAGPERYAENLATGRRLPMETVAYVAGVADSRVSQTWRLATRGKAVPGLFAAVAGARPAAAAPFARAGPRTLFVPLSTATAASEQAGTPAANEQGL